MDEQPGTDARRGWARGDLHRGFSSRRLPARRDTGRALLYGVAAGIALVCALAVLSKLLPSLYPTDPTAHYYATARLRYPFDYSDGVASSPRSGSRCSGTWPPVPARSGRERLERRSFLSCSCAWP